MRYQVIVPEKVQKQINALPSKVGDRIYARIATLKDDPRPDGVVKLRGLKDEYRIRVGDYRIRYEIHDQELIVTVVKVQHRKDVYRD
jgi:mRNA interferase RelE/StbE